MDTTCSVMVIPPKPMFDELKKLMDELNSTYAGKPIMPFPHVTLKSMGTMSGEKLEAAKPEIRRIADGTNPFLLDMGDIRFYGTNQDYPGIFLSVEKSVEIADLHAKLATALGQYSDGNDRSYKEFDNWNPHLSLALLDDRTELERARAEIGSKYRYGRFPQLSATCFRVMDIALLEYKKEHFPKTWYLSTPFELKKILY